MAKYMYNLLAVFLICSIFVTVNGRSFPGNDGEDAASDNNDDAPVKPTDGLPDSQGNSEAHRDSSAPVVRQKRTAEFSDGDCSYCCSGRKYCFHDGVRRRFHYDADWYWNRAQQTYVKICTVSFTELNGDRVSRNVGVQSDPCLHESQAWVDRYGVGSK